MIIKNILRNVHTPRSFTLALCIVFGISFALIFLECALWITGAYYMHFSGRSYLDAKDDANRIRIVALGESTTAPITGPAWPEFLENELNTRAGRPLFRVYNLGVAGSNSSAIFKRLTTEGMVLRPHIVITMMGVNDIKYMALPVVSHTWFARVVESITFSRTYKFLAIIGRLIQGNQHRALVEKALSCKNDELGDYEWVYTYLPQYESLIKELYPDRYSGQFSNSAEDQRAGAILVEFLREHPLSYQAYEVIVDHFASRSLWKDVNVWTQKFQDVQPLIRLCILTNTTAKKDAKDAMVRHLEDIGIFMESLSMVAQKITRDNGEDGVAFYDQIRFNIGVQNNASNINTAHVYEQMNTYLKNHGIFHVAMQYPILPARALKDIFKKDDVVTFVSNEENFQKALQTHAYSDIFMDNFAGVFGHTTPMGSHMIASSAADAILTIANPSYIQGLGL